MNMQALVADTPRSAYLPGYLETLGLVERLHRLLLPKKKQVHLTWLHRLPSGAKQPGSRASTAK